MAAEAENVNDVITVLKQKVVEYEKENEDAVNHHVCVSYSFLSGVCLYFGLGEPVYCHKFSPNIIDYLYEIEYAVKAYRMSLHPEQ